MDRYNRQGRASRASGRGAQQNRRGSWRYKRWEALYATNIFQVPPLRQWQWPKAGLGTSMETVLLASGVLGMAARLSMSSVSRDFLLFPLVSARHTRTCRLGWVRKAYVIYRFIATLHYTSVTGTCSSQGLPPMLMPGRSQAFADPKCYLRALGQGTTHSYILRLEVGQSRLLLLHKCCLLASEGGPAPTLLAPGLAPCSLLVSRLPGNKAVPQPLALHTAVVSGLAQPEGLPIPGKKRTEKWQLPSGPRWSRSSSRRCTGARTERREAGSRRRRQGRRGQRSPGGPGAYLGLRVKAQAPRKPQQMVL